MSRVRPLVIGIGNDQRGDDAAGLLAVRHLRSLVDDGLAEIAEHGRDGTSLIERWSGRSWVILVDAVSSEGPPGRIVPFDASDRSIEARDERGSTHALGPGGAIELARCLDRLPERVEVYGITGNSFAMGAETQPAVRSAAAQVARDLAGRLAVSSP